ncbi:FumA C-terminus/TtdB family hydratase beta subunit [Escherichia coli]|uniref:FumA C-terminus/TtdB family hydratase beta subunit n=1 Tax=Escherichia coli TaxID=562 RepID=UPI003B9C640D
MKKILTTPIKAEDLQDIRVGDVIYLTGTLVTCRDVCHRRLIELKRPIPYDLNGKAIFHAGPIVRKNGDKWEMVSVGPTTSMRMESFEREFIEQTGVKLVVGKGGMGPLTDAPRDKRTYFREINYIAAAFQYQKKNYNSA